MAPAKKSSGSAAPHTESGQQAGEDISHTTTREALREGELPTAQGQIEELQDVGAEVGSQLGTVAVVAVATALIKSELLPAVLIGAGAALLPKLLPGGGYVLRPVMKGVIRAGYTVFTTAQQLAAEASEQVQDMIAEVQAEQRSAQRRVEPNTGEYTATGAAETGRT